MPVLALNSHERCPGETVERGEITIAYDEVIAFAEAENNLGGAGILSKKDGVEVKKYRLFVMKLPFKVKLWRLILNRLSKNYRKELAC